jgi:hypothetical protein
MSDLPRIIIQPPDGQGGRRIRYDGKTLGVSVGSVAWGGVSGFEVRNFLGG